MPCIRKTRRSREDYAAIHAFVKEQSPQNADMLLREFDSKLAMLAATPSLGRLRSELGKGLRSWGLHGFSLFYRATGDGIELIRVLHASIDVLPSYFR